MMFWFDVILIFKEIWICFVILILYIISFNDKKGKWECIILCDFIFKFGLLDSYWYLW